MPTYEIVREWRESLRYGPIEAKDEKEALDKYWSGEGELIDDNWPFEDRDAEDKLYAEEV